MPPFHGSAPPYPFLRTENKLEKCSVFTILICAILAMCNKTSTSVGPLSLTENLKLRECSIDRWVSVFTISGYGFADVQQRFLDQGAIC